MVGFSFGKMFYNQMGLKPFFKISNQLKNIVMKQFVLTLMAFAFISFAQAQITAGYSNNFEDGTTQGWSNGPTSPNPPINIPDGGPNGAGDNFLREVSSGGAGAGSRLVAYNDETEWTGNYTAANIQSISFHAKNSGTTDLSLRIAMEGGDDTSEMVTNQFVPLPATQTDWILITIPILASDFTILNGLNTADEVLADMSDIRIISNPNLEFMGEVIDGSLDLDNITANGPLAVEDLFTRHLVAFPNPVTDQLTISSMFELDAFVIYDISGRKVAQGDANANLLQVGVSSLESGMYFVAVASGERSATLQILKK
jgi:hypothetical protein